MSSDAKNIYAYDNYRIYLRDILAFKKTTNKNFSIRNFARLAGFQSHSFIVSVLQGKKDLSETAIEKISKALKQNKDETYYFKNLVLLNQSKTSEEKADRYKDILRSRAFRAFHPLEESKMNYFTRWYYIVVRELLNLPDFKEDPKWIAEHMIPKITVEEATEALSELIKLGLLTRDADGKLVQTSAIVASPDEVRSAFMAHLHREWMRKASEAIDLVRREERDLSFVTFRVSKQTMQKFKEKIQNFRKELAEEASRDANPDAIYQLNLQLFPLTPFSEGEGS